MVLWIIGLSGAGKSTLATAVAEEVRRRMPNVALVDGDVLREVWGNDLGHTMEDRRKNADRLCRLCRFLDRQGIHVVAAILSLFEQSREWNRENLRDYREVYIKCPLPDLVRRDPKGLYAKGARGEIDLPGLTLPFAEPARPDLVIDNSSGLEALLAHAKTLASLFPGGREEN
ncbi:adenylyl-sulfate kinase [Nitratidesulfovibrio sp. HK-II]|uniref:adenylyl-sulfate kinase n=1 Tax=Nitratidesulfovibrio sp. HK-II TaxID=2009266 RepID=UPI000E2FC2C8|nr:adenylyl-sulfate kinase [Nitratidesulfovibrio sp. HK-II]GBO97677.1 adenylylsulfate kinase [Nitratidesulfovibrio sp. HK-II]